MIRRGISSILLAWILGCASGAVAGESDVRMEMPRLLTARGEIESAELSLQSSSAHGPMVISAGDFISGRNVIPSAALDIKVVVPWYQSASATRDVHRSDADGRVKVESLLVNDEQLVRVDDARQRNLLRSIDSRGAVAYIDISIPWSDRDGPQRLATTLRVRDADTLQPFMLEKDVPKHLWVTIEVPDSAAPGSYSSAVTLRDTLSGRVVATTILELVVYPFELDEPGAEYSLYYRGVLSHNGARFIGSEEKTREQMIIELRNMRRAGVTNPTVYQPFTDLDGLDQVLALRSAAGISNHTIYYLGLNTGNYRDDAYWSRTLRRLALLKPLIRKYGIREFYLYGIDEADVADVRGQYPLWRELSDAGFRIFAATWQRELVPEHAGHVSLLNCAAPLSSAEIAALRARGTRVFLYGMPQVGVQDPFLYRVNYGLALWRLGYDGEMDYAYQHEAGNIWNDFDDPTLRDHVFVYPTSDGIVETIPWHAFRQGINDYRYVQTMERRVATLASLGTPEGQQLAEQGRGYLETLRSQLPGDPGRVRRDIAAYLLRTDAIPRGPSPLAP